MRKLIELNKEIGEIFNPDIYIFNDYKNILYNGFWVNDIFNNKLFFYEWEDRVINKINDTLDLDSPLKIKFIKIFYQDVLEKYNDLIKIDVEDLEYLKSFKLSFSNLNKPENLCSEFYFSSDDFEYGGFLDKMSRIFEIENYNFYDGEYSPDTAKDVLEDEILDKLHNGEKSLVEIDEIKETVYTYKEQDLAEIERYYSYGFLSYCLENTRKLLKNIVKHLDNLVSLIKKLENFKEDKLSLDGVFDNDLTNVKFEFKISKKEIAILFKNLKDFGIFHVSKNGYLSEQTQLIKYIDNANMYFSHNGLLKPVKGITREFAKVYGNEERIMHRDKEKRFLKGLIEKIKESINKIDSEEN